MRGLAVVLVVEAMSKPEVMKEVNSAILEALEVLPSNDKHQMLVGFVLYDDEQHWWVRKDSETLFEKTRAI